MGRSPFVQPEIARLPLSDGTYIDIKKRLNHGEQEDMFFRMSPYVTETMQLDRRQVRTAKVLAYLLGWSLTMNGEADGPPVPMSPELSEDQRLSTIRSLDPVVFREMFDAIERHEEAMDKASQTQKKMASGAPVSSAISAPPSDAVGATSGSVN